jgi:hypothetical protein
MVRELERISKQMRGAPWTAHVRGARLRHKYTHARLLIAGRHVEVINCGCEIVAETCCFFSDVRLECLPCGRIFIGNGSYLNCNAEVVAGAQVHIGRDCKIAWDVLIMDTDQHGIGSQEARARPVGW